MAGSSPLGEAAGKAPPAAYYSFADIAEDCGLKHAQILVLLLHLGVEWKFLGNQHRVLTADYTRVRRAFLEAGRKVARFSEEALAPNRPGRRPGSRNKPKVAV